MNQKTVNKIIHINGDLKGADPEYIEALKRMCELTIIQIEETKTCENNE